MHSILSHIIEKKRNDLREQKRKLPINELKKELSKNKSVSNFRDKLIETSSSYISIIAEIKLASPTIPFLGSESEIVQRAITYEKAGVDGLSIITEKHYFKGSTAFIPQLKSKIPIPILQKDFVVDPYQIYEAKAIGSDAILLIARIVEKDTLQKFVRLSLTLGIEPVVEINDKEDLEKAVSTDTSFIAVNARDLRTFTVDVSKACRLLKKIPDTFIKLGFSGISSSDEVRKYKTSGVKGVLVGTKLMKALNADNFIKSLRNMNDIKVKICGIQTVEAAFGAIDAGSDYLGFSFVPTSKRYIEPEKALKIIEKIRGKIKIVGVFQNEDIKIVRKIAALLNLDYVQLHGHEDSGYVKRLKYRVIKVIASSDEITRYDVDYFLFDRVQQGKGEMVGVDMARTVSDALPIFFAGGLSPQNVASVVKKVKPFAVDVAGGVETNGIKDFEKMREFIKNVKGALL